MSEASLLTRNVDDKTSDSKNESITVLGVEIAHDEHQEVKNHVNRVVSIVIARFVVALTVYFFAICLLFSFALVKLNTTDGILTDVITNQNYIINAQHAGQMKSSKERNELIKILTSHTSEIQKINNVVNKEALH